jgi:hypothetical protein
VTTISLIECRNDKDNQSLSVHSSGWAVTSKVDSGSLTDCGEHLFRRLEAPQVSEVHLAQVHHRQPRGIFL